MTIKYITLILSITSSILVMHPAMSMKRSAESQLEQAVQANSSLEQVVQVNSSLEQVNNQQTEQPASQQELIKVLFQAARKGDCTQIQQAISLHAHIQATDVDGRTALHRAACECYPEAIRLLYRLGADLEARDNQGLTPLHALLLETYNDRHDLCRTMILLASLGANIHTVDNNGDTLVHTAVKKAPNKQGYIDFLDTLYYLGASFTIPNNNKLRPQEIVVIEHDDATSSFINAFIHQLLNAPDMLNPNEILHNPNEILSEGKTLLLESASNGWAGHVKNLLMNPALEISVKDSKKQTALHLAARRGCVEIIKQLLQTAIDVNAIDGNGDTALHLAAYRGHPETVELLVQDNRVDKHRTNCQGNTACHKIFVDQHALSYRLGGEHKTLAILLFYGLDPNKPNQANHTTKYLASWSEEFMKVFETHELIIIAGERLFIIGLPRELVIIVQRYMLENSYTYERTRIVDMRNAFSQMYQ